MNCTGSLGLPGASTRSAVNRTGQLVKRSVFRRVAPTIDPANDE